MKKEVTVDIRMKIVDEACAMQYLSSLPESWVYIKNLSRKKGKWNKLLHTQNLR